MNELLLPFTLRRLRDRLHRPNKTMQSLVPGLRLDRDGGGWINTPLPGASQSQIIRKAELKATMEGDLEGKLTLTYTGLEALTKRSRQRYEDDQARKKYMEELVKDYISVESEVEMTNHPDWQSSSPELVAEFKVKIPGWISSIGKRMLLPVGIFSASEKGLFDHVERLYPVYFDYPFQKVDDIQIELPEEMAISNLPAPAQRPGQVASYTLTAEKDKNVLRIKRTLKVDALILQVNQYPALRSFYQYVRTGDDAQVMVQPQVAAASK